MASKSHTHTFLTHSIKTLFRRSTQNGVCTGGSVRQKNWWHSGQVKLLQTESIYELHWKNESTMEFWISGWTATSRGVGNTEYGKRFWPSISTTQMVIWSHCDGTWRSKHHRQPHVFGILCGVREHENITSPSCGSCCVLSRLVTTARTVTDDWAPLVQKGDCGT
jgi:hypothetical protein